MKIRYPLKYPYALSTADIALSFQTDPAMGLSEAEALKRNKLFGSNSYKTRRQKSTVLILIQQFKSPIVYLLIFGAFVSFYFSDYLETAAIVAVILINAIIGFFMELQASNSMNALKKMDIILSKVIRNGEIKEVSAEQLVPGDLFVLEAGDVIPADGRLIESNQLQCDESSLTGESQPSLKHTENIPEDTMVGDQQNMVFKGASVMNGNAQIITTGIGENTQLGIITSLVDNAAETVTPLDKKLNGLSRKLIWVTLVMTAIFATAGLIKGKPLLLIIETSIALAVAAIPEGLPVVATVALSYGMLLMAKRNAIVKKLSAVETLGGTSVILTDKTGTLTENRIHADTLVFPDDKVKVVIENGLLKYNADHISKSCENFRKVLLTGALCNDAPAHTNSETKKTRGDAVEIALVQLVNTSGGNVENIRKEYARVAEVPFSSEIMMMANLHQSAGGYFSAAKGSVEHLLEHCTKIQHDETIKAIDADNRKNIIEQSEKMAVMGLRVLAFAYRNDVDLNEKNYLDDLVYLGLIGFLDPPRLDIKGAILSCRNAGIKVVMITGDHPRTALNIARKVGLTDENETRVIIGKELPPMESLSADWKKKILSTVVFARTTPQQKLEIAAVFQAAGNIVAMTGDGVNDAPALKQADVGIAMGLRGTQVAKETASIVLKDDSFTSIAEAVSHGREIFQNIQKFVVYLVSCNLGEIFIVTLLGIITPASTLLPLQILFLNMVTDIFPALALGLGNGDETVMLKPPRDPKKGIITNKTWVIIGIYATAMTVAVICAVVYCNAFISTDSNVVNNAAFITLIFTQLFHVFNMRSSGSKVLVNEITGNKFVWMALLICGGLVLLVYSIPETRLILNLRVLPARVWLVSIIAGLLPLLSVQLYKILTYKKAKFSSGF
ncbi:cation-translocating P-type ATPase [Mucilaginibacter xinganensis]|uniref:ATPase n=1 Tax=Mucilaginibacter xinganensis TaxID=1234841 RepID=A0A223NRC5_9SPHI|nr:cation-transporting P-type ATPase [Mucilaginibacter xinganensis]ASU32387.1 ATPase [Mucilaginibacter xinganensis]